MPNKILLSPGLLQLPAIALTLSACIAADPAGEEDDLSFQGDKVADACSGLTANGISAKARTFMKNNQLIAEGEELSFFGIDVKWRALKLQPAGDKCLVAMILSEDTTHMAGASFEVLVVKKTPSQIRFRTFRESDAPSGEVQVAIGAVIPDVSFDGVEESFLPKDFYYAVLANDSRLAYYKTIAAQIAPLVCGFSAEVSASDMRVEDFMLRGEPDGKYDWDPTEGRNWKLKNAKFSLRRGSTIEAEDVRPRFFDEDFAGYLAGSNGKIAPWNACFLRKALVQGTWKDLVSEPQ